MRLPGKRTLGCYNEVAGKTSMEQPSQKVPTSTVAGTVPWQCWKSNIQALPQVIMIFPGSPRILSPNQRQICFQTASFSMELSDWLSLSHDHLCGRGCACACGCDCHNAKISLFCTSKVSLIASYFCLIVSNLLSLQVQLPQTKAAFPAPKYCESSPLERQKQIVCRNAVADGTVLCKFRLVLAPELRNDTSTEQIMHLSITVIWVLLLSMFWGFLSVIFQYFWRLRKQKRIVCCRM